MLLHRFYEKLIQNCPFPEGDGGGWNRWADAKAQYADEIDDFNPFLALLPMLNSDALPVADGVESIFPIDIITGEYKKGAKYLP